MTLTGSRCAIVRRSNGERALNRRTQRTVEVRPLRRRHRSRHHQLGAWPSGDRAASVRRTSSRCRSSSPPATSRRGRRCRRSSISPIEHERRGDAAAALDGAAGARRRRVRARPGRARARRGWSRRRSRGSPRRRRSHRADPAVGRDAGRAAVAGRGLGALPRAPARRLESRAARAATRRSASSAGDRAHRAGLVRRRGARADRRRRRSRPGSPA